MIGRAKSIKQETITCGELRVTLIKYVIRYQYLYIILSDPQAAIVNEYTRKRNARHILQHCIG